MTAGDQRPDDGAKALLAMAIARDLLGARRNDTDCAAPGAALEPASVGRFELRKLETSRTNRYPLHPSHHVNTFAEELGTVLLEQGMPDETRQTELARLLFDGMHPVSVGEQPGINDPMTRRWPSPEAPASETTTRGTGDEPPPSRGRHHAQPPEAGTDTGGRGA